MQMATIEKIKELIDGNRTEEAIRTLDKLIEENPADDSLLFLRGNAYRKHNDWKNAVSDYCKAADINPESPAAAAYKAAMEILNFYNKDLLNP